MAVYRYCSAIGKLFLLFLAGTLVVSNLNCTVEFPPATLSAPNGTVGVYDSSCVDGQECIDFSVFAHGGESFGGLISLNIWALPLNFNQGLSCADGYADDFNGDGITETPYQYLRSVVASRISEPEGGGEAYQREIQSAAYDMYLLHKGNKTFTVEDAVSEINDPNLNDFTQQVSVFVDYNVFPGYVNGVIDETTPPAPYSVCECYYLGASVFDSIERVESELIEVATVPICPTPTPTANRPGSGISPYSPDFQWTIKSQGMQAEIEYIKTALDGTPDWTDTVNIKIITAIPTTDSNYTLTAPITVTSTTEFAWRVRTYCPLNSDNGLCAEDWVDGNNFLVTVP